MLTTGEVVVTATIVSIMNTNLSFYDFVHSALQRHQSLDFGDLDAHDLKANQEALKHGSRESSQLTYCLFVWIVGIARFISLQRLIGLVLLFCSHEY